MEWLTKLDTSKYYYDKEAGEKPIRFIERYCVFTDGELIGQPIKLDELQKNEIRQFYGVKRKSDGKDRYNIWYFETPKTTGKSFIACCLALYDLIAGPHKIPKVAAVAATYRQVDDAIFGKAKLIIQLSPVLQQLLAQEKIVIQEKVIKNRSNRGEWRIISSSNKGASGAAITTYVVDELHEWLDKDEKVLETYILNQNTKIKNGKGKIIIATNSGTNLDSLCGRWHKRCMKIKEGVTTEDNILVTIWNTDKTDISSPETWREANPMIGTTVDEFIYQQEYLATIGNKSKELTFRRLMLGQWTMEGKAWLKPDDVHKAEIDSLPDNLNEMPLWIGYDAAPHGDITSIVYLWYDVKTDIIYAKNSNFIPQDTANHYIKSNGIPYLEWHELGYCYLVDGKTLSVHNMAEIERILLEGQKPEIFCYDKGWSGSVPITLEKAGWITEDIPSSPFSTDKPSRELEARIMDGRFKFLKNDCYRWQLKNCTLLINKENKQKPIRMSDPQKYDAVMATIYAMSRAILTICGVEAEKDDSQIRKEKMKNWDGKIVFS